MATAINQPDSLWDISLLYCVRNLQTFCVQELAVTNNDQTVYNWKLREGLTLPLEVCESLLTAFLANHYREPDEPDYYDYKLNSFLHIFQDTLRTRLKRVNLSRMQVVDTALEWILSHKLTELDISDNSALRNLSMHCINTYGDNLTKLNIGNTTVIFNDLDPVQLDENDSSAIKPPCHCLPIPKTSSIQDYLLSRDKCADHKHESQRDPLFMREYVFDLPNLRWLSIHDLSHNAYDMILTLLKPLTKLTYLDLSGCGVDAELLMGVQSYAHIRSLTLYDVQISNLEDTLIAIGKLKTLRHLDISQGKEQHVLYDEPEQRLRYIVNALPNLVSLDISGTNLAGMEPNDYLTKTLKFEEERQQYPHCPIYGLEGRSFEFLGLLYCTTEPCNRENIPAKKVTGDKTEEQVLVSIQANIEKTELLIRSLNHLFRIFRYSICKSPAVALKGILTAMKKHVFDRSVQISGSASLFYIVKGKERSMLNVATRRDIITTILAGMESHMDEATMMRNGCLTLCHFKIPQDVIYEYPRVIKVLLNMISPPDQEEFVQRIGIHLLNSLACQVDGKEKQLVGDYGAIETMLETVRNRLRQNICDEVMEIAWSTMWNVTDETAINCERFIADKGLDLFLQCLETFPEKPELLRNMMGLMGNVAEVPYLRKYLITPQYISVFSELLMSKSDGIEVSYNAAGVLSHIASDGPKVWTISSPTRKEVLQNLSTAIEKWDLDTKRNINYRSFAPILRLLPIHETPEVQHWAIWALCNLTRVYPNKYCQLLVNENGIELIEQVALDQRPYPRIRELSSMVLECCRNWKIGGARDDNDIRDDNDPSNMEG
ncbi:unnamed protein product [Owenia fusiformis]|uniref:Protein zer-1 homolog n=1 Tax=Owenia fusiformis TaxID=6347 RepID=A0A8J1U113_OWEFU|nr:unnamed protein product [Owenia fusiformis]